MMAAIQTRIKTSKSPTHTDVSIPYVTANGVVRYYKVGSGIDLPDDFKDWYKPEKLLG